MRLAEGTEIGAGIRRMPSPVVATGLVVAVATVLAATNVPAGSLSGHMAAHIATMNFVAPLVALALLTRFRGTAEARVLYLAAVLQMAFLWTAHLPVLHGPGASNSLIAVALQAGLFAVAVAFWTAVLTVGRHEPWHAIVALLLTGKLACLLGALLFFAPVALYGHGHGDELADQQRAGLMMLAACPLTYVVAGLFYATRIVAPARPRQ
jgi:putative membrane protein